MAFDIDNPEVANVSKFAIFDILKLAPRLGEKNIITKLFFSHPRCDFLILFYFRNPRNQVIPVIYRKWSIEWLG